MPPSSTHLPRYLQIAEMLIRDISSGRLVDGTKLPPERDMAADLGIAVGTLRKALDDLAGKGLLERVQGSGNYIRHNPDAPSVYALFRLERLSGGGLPTARILDVTRLPKPGDLPPFGSAPDAHRIRRERSLSGQPAALEDIWLDAAWADTVRAADIADSLYYFYRTALGLHIARVEDRVGIAPLPDWPGTDIGCAAGTPVGFAERFSFAPDGTIAEFSRTWFNPDRVRYVSRFK